MPAQDFPHLLPFLLAIRRLIPNCRMIQLTPARQLRKSREEQCQFTTGLAWTRGCFMRFM